MEQMPNLPYLLHPPALTAYRCLSPRHLLIPTFSDVKVMEADFIFSVTRELTVQDLEIPMETNARNGYLFLQPPLPEKTDSLITFIPLNIHCLHLSLLNSKSGFHRDMLQHRLYTSLLILIM